MTAPACRGFMRLILFAIAWAACAPAARGRPAARTEPRRFTDPSPGTWLTIFGLGAATMLSRPFENSETAAKLLDSSGFDPLIDAADWYGDGAVLGAGTLGVTLVGRATGSRRMQAFGGDLAESLVLSAGVVWSLKTTINAKRPNGGKYSFPSGHTAAAFTIAPVVQRHFGTKAGVVAYTMASITGLARMEERRHYLSDVLFGAAIGIASGRETIRGNGLRAIVNRLRVTGDGVAVTYGF